MQASSISYRAYAIDLWGFGDTAKNPSYYSLEQQTTLLEEFTDAMGIGKIALVGHGLGAIVCLLYTARHPQLVDRIMAISYPFTDSALNARLRSAKPVELVDWLLAALPIHGVGLDRSIQNRSQGNYPCRYPGLQTRPGRGVQQALHTSPVRSRCDRHRHHPPRIRTAWRSGQKTPIVSYLTNPAIFPMLEETSMFNRLVLDFLSLSSGESPRQLQIEGSMEAARALGLHKSSIPMAISNSKSEIGRIRSSCH